MCGHNISKIICFQCGNMEILEKKSSEHLSCRGTMVRQMEVYMGTFHDYNLQPSLIQTEEKNQIELIICATLKRSIVSLISSSHSSITDRFNDLMNETKRATVYKIKQFLYLISKMNNHTVCSAQKTALLFNDPKLYPEKAIYLKIFMLFYWNFHSEFFRIKALIKKIIAVKTNQ